MARLVTGRQEARVRPRRAHHRAELGRQRYRGDTGHPPTQFDLLPAFSPDGTKITYARNLDTVGPGGSEASGLFVMNANGTGVAGFPGLGGQLVGLDQTGDWGSAPLTGTQPPPPPSGGGAGCSSSKEPDSNGDLHSHCHIGAKGRGAGGNDKQNRHH